MARIKPKQPSNLAEPSTLSLTLLLSVAANVLTWAAFPPLGLFPLAWLVPLIWARLIRAEQLPGRRPYWVIWGTSALMWAVLLEGVGRAYWANYFGLVLLGSYLAVYQVVFVGLSRIAVHRWKLAMVVAAPVVWTGLELVRGHLFTGFSIGLLGHTQINATSLIQVADLFGAYGISFLVVFVGTCLSQSIPQAGVRGRPAMLLIAGGVLTCVYFYGLSRIAALRQIPVEARLKVALIQGTEDTILDSDAETARQRAIDTFNQYWRLTLDACERHADIDLVIWPEGVFSGGVPQVVVNGTVDPPPDAAGLDAASFREAVGQAARRFDEKTDTIARGVNRTARDGTEAEPRTYLLVGCDTVALSGDDQQTYNAALLIDPHGAIAARYDKMHRVLLGEYVPLGDRFPWLYDLVPLGRGLTPGTHPASLDVHGVNLSPSICFEDTVPHLIRRQVRELSAQSDRPDILVNLTNDGWFWGSSILDLQLACAVFRAVELRRSLLVAANTGLSASIDSNGTVRETLARRAEGAIVTEIAVRRRTSFYQQWGDLFAGCCLVICIALVVSGGCDRWKGGRCDGRTTKA